MLPEAHRWILEQFEPEGDPWLLLSVAQELEIAGQREGAAAVLDRAFGIDPTLDPIRDARARLLDQLAVVEHGLTFRYVPAGPFLMGSRDGEPDEQPLHPVWLKAYWLSETPVSWADYCRLMGWQAPPEGRPSDYSQEPVGEDAEFELFNLNKIRIQYCEDYTTRAVSWHSHLSADPRDGPPRSLADAPRGYSLKPMVAVAWQDALDLAGRLTSRKARYTLPTEAQWEKAARGGLIGARYPWGDEPPTSAHCDFGRFHEFSLRAMKAFSPNGYGLYSMSGGVWEWTLDWYDRDGYRASADHDPPGPAKGKQKVLRGGSWADCAEAVTASFRMSLAPSSWREDRGGCGVPSVGFRLARVAP